MTFSIVARSADGRSHGVAVASKFLAVGAAVLGQGYRGTSDIVADLRADDHPDPVPELSRLLELYFDKPDPATLLDLTGALATEVGTRLAELGHAGADLDSALASWAGVDNLEERLVPGRLDPLVLNHLRGPAVSRSESSVGM